MTDSHTRPRLIHWMGYLALTFLILLPVAVLTVRSGQWQSGLMLYALAALGSLLVFTLCAIFLVMPKFSTWRPDIGKRALMALPGAVLMLSLLGSGGAPQIHDITTDTIDPPQFVTAEKERGEGANTLAIKEDFIAQQKAAYPDLQALRTVLSQEDAFTRALEIASSLGWRVYYENRNTGIIEAVDITGIMAFKDDVVIRVRTDAAGTKLDLRSVSRVGLGDLGANAERIRRFQAAFAE